MEKNVLGANALAYFSQVSARKKKFYNIDSMLIKSLMFDNE
jgi:hypothetical protein